jgi:pimeloyl-ACP methyl ester carboxylesterase
MSGAPRAEEQFANLDGHRVKSLPRFRYEVLTGVGHYPMLEKPDQVNAALTRVAASVQQMQ